MENEIVLFETEDHEVKLHVPVENNTVWLNRKQLAELFGRDVKTIGKHINNALRMFPMFFCKPRKMQKPLLTSLWFMPITR